MEDRYNYRYKFVSDLGDNSFYYSINKIFLITF